MLLVVGWLLTASGLAQFPETPIFAAQRGDSAVGEGFGLEMRVIPSPNQERGFGLSDDAQPGTWLGAMVTLAALPSDNPMKGASKGMESAPKMPRSDLGNVSFDRTAASLDVQKKRTGETG